MRLFLMLALLLATGCTHTHVIGDTVDVRHVNKRAERERVLLSFDDGRRVQAESLLLTWTQVAWIDPATRLPQTAPLHELNNVELMDRQQGGLEGLGVGALLGAGIGAVAGGLMAVSERTNGDVHFGPGLVTLYLGGFGGAVGGGIGMVTGWGGGSHSIYFVPSAPDGSVPAERWWERNEPSGFAATLLQRQLDALHAVSRSFPEVEGPLPTASSMLLRGER